ncbi:MAG: hypothetical protein COA78_24845 [Blastopirellula sp.]|nr:MAG: hypothetical protein COA78_24845 [Blastopirellula sp.]
MAHSRVRFIPRGGSGSIPDAWHCKRELFDAQGFTLVACSFDVEQCKRPGKQPVQRSLENDIILEKTE